MIVAALLHLRMRLFLIFCIGAFIINKAVAQQGHARFEAKEFVQGKDKLPYRILFPESYSHARTYPLVLFLHGAGERGKDNKSQLIHGSDLFLSDSVSKNFPAIVVFPQCPKKDYWSSANVDRSTAPLTLTFNYDAPNTPALRGVIGLMKQLIKNESVDRSRVYVMGLSMGGMGTFELIHREPRMFAAAIPICGGGDTLRYHRRARQVPFWIFHGEADNVVSVAHSRAMAGMLRSRSNLVRYTEYPGVQHNSWDNAFRDPFLLQWLFSNKR